MPLSKDMSHCPIDVIYLNFSTPGWTPKWLLFIIGFIHHLSTPLRGCFFSLLSYSATRLREHILCCMRRLAILKNDSTAEKRREEEAFALASIAHYYFVKTKTNCDTCPLYYLRMSGICPQCWLSGTLAGPLVVI